MNRKPFLQIPGVIISLITIGLTSIIFIGQIYISTKVMSHMEREQKLSGQIHLMEKISKTVSKLELGVSMNTPENALRGKSFLTQALVELDYLNKELRSAGFQTRDSLFDILDRLSSEGKHVLESELYWKKPRKNEVDLGLDLEKRFLFKSIIFLSNRYFISSLNNERRLKKESQQIQAERQTTNKYHFLFLILSLVATLSIIVFMWRIVANSIRGQERILQQSDELLANKKDLEVRVYERTKELEFARKIAEDANRAKTMFLANISHEIRTPMHGVLSFAEIGIEQAKTGTREELEDFFKEIQETGNRLMRLLNDLLDLSKLEAGKITYDFKRGNLVSVIQSSLSQFSKFAQEKGVAFDFKNEVGDLELEFDDQKIHQVLGNLLSNAVKFCFQNEAVYITLRRSSDLFVEITVQNRGTEIPEKELELIFDKFTQSTKTRSKAGGTGLGLPICKRIISDHGGKIWAECENHIVRFRFTLPTRKASQKAA